MKKLFFLLSLLLAAVVITAGCTAPSTPSAEPTSQAGGASHYTITTDAYVATYDITNSNGVLSGNQKIAYKDNYHSYDAALVNDVVPKIIKQYQNNPITINPDGKTVVFTLKSTEVTETVNGEKLTITAVSATEIYQNGQPIRTEYFTQ
ncbi:MAG: hypothetical protein Q4Q53_03090 [Methanocorpusculum sp.]|nr:hypothetical protein [Methanocorpusculum sp.]